MGRQQFNDGMEVVFEDHNKVHQRVEKEFYDRVIYEMLQRAEDRFFDDSFNVSVATTTSVTVNSGVGFQTDLTVTAPEPTKRLLYLGSNLTVNVTAPDVVNDRIDLIVAKHQRVVTETESRKFKNASTSVITNENLDVASDWETEVISVDGTPAGSPVAPAVPAGYIKIAEVLVKAVAGIDNPANITDTRSLMPVGGSATINSSAFVRLTPSAALSLQQALEEVDQLLRDGLVRQNDFEDRVTDPAVPAASHLRLYNKGGLLYVRENSGAITPVGSGGGGGGGGANWVGDALEMEEFSEKVWLYSQGETQKLTLYVRVPNGYLAGRQITSYLGAYSPSASDDWKMQIVTSLVRKGQDAIDSVTNQETNDSGDIVNDQANEYRELVIDLTTAIGQVNGFGVSPGDLLRLELTRQAPAGTEDTADLRLVPSSTEVKFG